MYPRTRVARFGRMLIALSAAAFAAALSAGCGGKPEAGRPTRRAPTSPAEKALLDLSDRYADLDSFSERTRITRTVSSADGEEVATYQTQFFFRRPNRILYRIANDDTTVIVCDGRRLTVYSSADNGYVEHDPPEDLAAFVRDHHTDAIGLDEVLLLAGADPFEPLEDVTMSEGESLDDRPMRVIKAGLRQLAERGSDEPAAGTQSLWFGDDNLIHKAVLDIQRGEVALHIEELMKELAPDPSLPDDLFDYHPPKGTKDLTPR